MKISTILASAILGVSAQGAAMAQTELNSRPAASPTPGTNPPAMQAARPGDLSRYRTSALELNLGWGGPYGGLGVSYAHLLGAQTDVNVGVGIGVGGKIGVGVRHFLSPSKIVSPFFAVNLSRSGRIDDVNITLDEGMPSEETVQYSQSASGILHLRGGIRWQPGRVGLLATLGYGARFTGNPVSYGNGQLPSQRMRDLVEIVAPGGIEFSVGMSIGLGQ